MFDDRVDAGRALAARLQHLRGHDPVVLGLPRGGVPVAAEVARALGAPLDVVVVRKLGVPWQPELAMGAVGEGDVVVRHEEVLRRGRIREEQVQQVLARERAEVERRGALLRGARARIPLEGRTAVVVDDGLATGSTARAACRVVRAAGAARVVLAVPVAPQDTVALLRDDADEVVVVEAPQSFSAVGAWYRDFRPTGDDEVVRLLEDADRGSDDEVVVDAGRVSLLARLTVPARPLGLVVFAHGSGSGRRSPRNAAVAEALHERGLATLLVDLLTVDEEGNRSAVFDVPLLAERLRAASDWAGAQAACAHLRLGWFGASTGAAAALWAAADPGADVAAVVSRGGRPDLAGARLDTVRAPVLLLVGGRDTEVLELNRRAQARLSGPSELVVVPGATHLFEEPGALTTVADAAGDWFVRHLDRLGP